MWLSWPYNGASILSYVHMVPYTWCCIHALRPAPPRAIPRPAQVVDPHPSQAFRFAGMHAYRDNDTLAQRDAWRSRAAWDAQYFSRRRPPNTPPAAAYWPPAAPSEQLPAAVRRHAAQQAAVQAAVQSGASPDDGRDSAASALRRATGDVGCLELLLRAAHAHGGMLHSLLRPAYLDPGFLGQAVQR